MLVFTIVVTPFTSVTLFTLTLSLFLFSELSFIRMQPPSFFFYLDETSFFISFIRFFVIFSSYFFSSCTKVSNVTLYVILLFCLGVFISNRLLIVYFFYEASLFPILYIILKWGSYPERSLRSVMLLIYTAVFTLPFIYVVFYIFNTNSSLSLPLLSLRATCVNSPLLVTIAFCCFSVKLPIYGLHFWLPMAHVEAPTFGSIILAGVLLKLGGVGLIRVTLIISLNSLIGFLLSYFMLGLSFVTLICCIQSDIKRLIAYSSVSHIIVLPPLLVMNTTSRISAAMIIMLIHGIASPLLFMLVGTIYSMFSTRQLVFVRGLLLASPLISFISVMAFLFTLSAPPFPSFVAEIGFLISAVLVSRYFIPFLLVFCFLSLLYNLNWVRSIIFSNSSPSTYSHSYLYSSFLPMLVSILMSVILLPILAYL